MGAVVPTRRALLVTATISDWISFGAGTGTASGMLGINFFLLFIIIGTGSTAVTIAFFLLLLSTRVGKGR